MDAEALLPPRSSALDEETARAEVYGLLAQLFYAVPPADLLDALRVAVTEAPAAGAFLQEPWQQLVGVARELPDTAIQAEYQALFEGVGKPEVYLFGSHYLSGFLNEKPLAKLRTDLAGLGLARLAAFQVREDIAAGRLAPVLEDCNPGDMEEVHAVYVGQGGYLPLRVRAFLDFLAEKVDIGQHVSFKR